MNDLFTNFLNVFGLAWWVEISTDNPRCTYYFGPFDDELAAKAAQGGYIEDLEQEGARGIKVMIKRCKPSQLTVDEDLGKRDSQGVARAYSG